MNFKKRINKVIKWHLGIPLIRQMCLTNINDLFCLSTKLQNRYVTKMFNCATALQVLTEICSVLV